MENSFVNDSDVQVNALIDLITTLTDEQQERLFAELDRYRGRSNGC